MLHPEHTGIRPAAGRAAGFMVASPFLPLAAPTPVGAGGAAELKGRAAVLDTGAGGGGGAAAADGTQGLAVAATATGVCAGWKVGAETGSIVKKK